jgi:hypothetical protein
MRLPRALALSACLAACEDPLRENAAETLGPEDPGVVEGPLHRPGQPCLVCHDDGRARAFSVAGTVYLSPDSEEPAPGASVLLVDAVEQRFEAVTNCAGNFFVKPEELEPVYPLWVSLRAGAWTIAMDSPVNRDGSCAGCHEPARGPASAGRVYLFSIAGEPAAAGCP